MRAVVLIAAAVVICLFPAPAGAEWVVKAFGGVTFGSSHGFVDLEQASGSTKPIVGGGVDWQRKSLAIGGEIAVSPGFFKNGGELVHTGTLATVMANVTWHTRPAARLRPYATGGIGIARIAIDDVLGAFNSRSTLLAANVGGGVTWQYTQLVLVYGDMRYLRTQYGGQNSAALGDEFVAFTRLTGGLGFRFH